MATRVRIVLLALLIAGAVIALRAVPLAEEAPTPGRPGDPDEAVAILMLLTLPALTLLVFAALRYRPEHLPSVPRDERQRPSWRGAVIAVLVLLVLAAGLALLPRTGSREPGGRTRQNRGEQAPRDGEPATNAPPAGQGDLDIELWSIFVLATMLLLLAVSAAARRRAPRSDHEFDADDLDPVRRRQRLALAVRNALSTVEEVTRDPRKSIIRCYAAMERALIDTPGAEPKPADTPSDVLGRAAEAGHIHSESGRRLVDLFSEARYSSHAMTDGDVAIAAATLREILDDLGRQAWARW